MVANSSLPTPPHSSAPPTDRHLPIQVHQRRRLLGFQEDEDDDDDDDDDDEHGGHDSRWNDRADRKGSRSSASNRTRRTDQLLTGFDRDGALTKEKSPPRQGPMVIPMVANKLDWREDRKKRLGLGEKARSLGPLVSMRSAASPANESNRRRRTEDERGTAEQDPSAPERINSGEQKRGLEILPRRRVADQEGSLDEGARREDGTEAKGEGERTATDEATQRRDRATASTPPISETRGEPTPARETAEQAAIRALLAGEADQDSARQAREDLVIPQPSEQELLQNDLESRPEAPTLDDYAATPIDQFGAALLRGMGWKEGMGAGRRRDGPQRAPEPKRRAALLGLGAKERPSSQGASSSLARPGGSNAPSKSSSRRPERRYVPVIARESAGASRSEQGPSSRRGEETPSSGRSGDGEEAGRDRRRYRSRSPESSRHRHHARDGHGGSERERERERARESHRRRRGDDREDDRDGGRGSRRPEVARSEFPREGRERRDGGDRERERRRGERGSDRDRERERDRERGEGRSGYRDERSRHR
ncbi:hypothetical protein IE53DRAFT_371226 [Violaceomyces palustris]|uniref:Uncharacterized protein n=1 Tax=Violaceomyces palustris TaxID=1673888 RepID=A0ACD0NPH3_9BASI|nr:hypothetical protein IE53DRAFT_371226 [Violaceomyces palustris]